MIGTTLAGKYEVKRELFLDKLGPAFLGTALQGGYSVCIQTVAKGPSPAPEALAAIRSVSERIREIDSPALVPVIDWGSTPDGGFFFVSPLPESVPLSVFSKGGLMLGAAVDLAFQVSTAMGVAAQEGLAHGWISGDWVLVSEIPGAGQAARIIGWGLSELLPAYAANQKDDRFRGVPEYLSPEVCSGKGSSPQSELYSLGILLYQMVTGKPPFISSNFATTLKRQIYEKPLPLHLLKRGVANIGEYEKVVFKALQKIPTKRQETLNQLARELHDFRDQFLPEVEFATVPSPGWPSLLVGTGAPEPVAVRKPAPAPRPSSDTMRLTDVGAPAPEPAMAQEEAGAGEPVEQGDTMKIGEGDRTAFAPEPEPTPAAVGVAAEGPALAAQESREDEAGAAVEQAAAAPGESVAGATQMFEAVRPSEPAESAKATPSPKKSKGKKGAGPVAAPVPSESVAKPQGGAAKPQDGAAKPQDEDWFVQSPQELAEREVTDTWSHKKPKSSARFYIVVGAIGLVVVAALVFGMSQMNKGEQEKAEKERVVSAEAARRAEEAKAVAARQAEVDRKAAEKKQREAEERARDEELKNKIKEQARVASEKERLRAEQNAEQERLLAEKAQLEGQRKALQAQQDLVKFNEGLDGYRNRLKERKALWQERSNLVKVSQVNELIAELGQLQTRAAEITIPENGKNIDKVLETLTQLNTDFSAASQKAEAVLGEDPDAPTVAGGASDQVDAAAAEEAARKAAEEEAARKAAEEEAARKAAEAAASPGTAAEEAAKKKAEEAEAKKLAAEEAARKKAEEAEAKKLAAEEAARKKAEEAAAKKSGQDDAAKKKEEEAAKKKAAEEAAKKKAAEEAAKKKAEEEAAKKASAGEAADLSKKGLAAMKEKKYDEAISLFTQAKAAGGDARVLNKYIDKAEGEKKAAAAKTEEVKKEEVKKEEVKKEEKKAEPEGGADKAKHLQANGMKAMKAGNKKLAIKYFEKAKEAGGDAALLDKLIKKCEE